MAQSRLLQGETRRLAAFPLGFAAMHRIASAMLIVAAVLALNAGMVREAFSAPAATVRAEPIRVEPPRSTRVLSLLLVLETLRQAQAAADRQKV